MSGLENGDDSPKVDNDETPAPVPTDLTEVREGPPQPSESLAEQPAEPHGASDEPQVSEDVAEAVDGGSAEVGKAGRESLTGSLNEQAQPSEGTRKPSANPASRSGRALTPSSEFPISDASEARAADQWADLHSGGSPPSRKKRWGHIPPDSSVGTLPPLSLGGGETSRTTPVHFRDSRSAIHSSHRVRPVTRERPSRTGTLTPLRNPLRMKTKDEYDLFRAKNGVHVNYKGPVHVVEEMHVTCALCGGPVDPVSRASAGKLFFHPQCLQCCLCGRSGPTEVFFQALGPNAVCSDCSVRGFARCVPREIAEKRGVVLGANRGKFMEAMRSRDRAQRGSNKNNALTEGIVPPTVVMSPLHNRRNSTNRQMALIRRQLYYTQNDNNVLFLPPPVLTSENEDLQIDGVPQFDRTS